MQGLSVWERLESKSALIHQKWFDLTIDTYPNETARFLRQKRDRFLNPVSHIVSQELGALYHQLIHDMDIPKMRLSLDRIIRIRSVQEFMPSQAIGFVLQLKQLVREEFRGELTGERSLEELREFEARVDTLAILAFDTYTACRQEVFEIRVNELVAARQQALDMLARASRAGD